MNSLNTETDADEHHHSYNEIEDIIFVDRKLDYVKNSEAEAESSDIKIDCLINEKDKRSDQIVQQSETPSLIDQPNCDNDDGSSGSSMKHTENRVVVKTSSSTGDDLSLNAEDLLLSSDELAEIIAAQKHQSSTILLDQHEQLPTMEHDYDDVHDADQQLFNFQDPKKTMDVWSQTNDHNENEEVFYREQDTDIASEQDVSIQMQQSVMHSAVCKDNIANLYQEPEAFIKIGSQLAMMGSNCQQQYDNNVESDLTPQNQYNSEADNGVHINATPIVSSFVAFKYCFLACVAIILTLGLLHNTLYIIGDNNDLHQHTNAGDNFAVISTTLVANKNNNVISNDRSSLSYPGSYQAQKSKVEERTGSKLELDSICNAPIPTNDSLKQLAIIGVETKIEDIYGAITEDTWRKSRDNGFSKFLEDWARFIEIWKTDLTAVYYDLAMYLTYEGLLGLTTGPQVVQQLAGILRAEGYATISDADIPCAWYKGIGRQRLEMHQKNGYEYNDYIPGYKDYQRDEMLQKMSLMIEQQKANGDPNLAAILEYYHDDIAFHTRVDEATASPLVATQTSTVTKTTVFAKPIPKNEKQWGASVNLPGNLEASLGTTTAVAQQGQKVAAQQGENGAASVSVSGSSNSGHAGQWLKCDQTQIKLPVSNPHKWETKPIWFPGFLDAVESQILRDITIGLTGLSKPVKRFSSHSIAGTRNCWGETETVACMVLHPAVKMDPGPDIRIKKYSENLVFLLRNPKTAIPHHFNLQAARDNNDITNQFTGQISADQWKRERDEKFETMLQSWKDVLATWKYSKYKVGLYLSYERFMDYKTGPQTLLSLAHLLRGEGFKTVSDDNMLCTWYERVGKDRLAAYHRNNGYEYGDYVPSYTIQQRDAMLAEMSNLIETYKSDRELVSILQEYHDDIRDNTSIDGIGVVSASTKANPSPQLKAGSGSTTLPQQKISPGAESSNNATMPLFQNSNEGANEVLQVASKEVSTEAGPNFEEWEKCPATSSSLLPSPRAKWETKPLFFPTFPDSLDPNMLSKIMHQISGMTYPVKMYHNGFETHSKGCYGNTETAACHTNHPYITIHHPGIEELSDKFNQQIVLMLRSPKTALPRHHNGKENSFHGGEGQVDEAKWRLTRDTYFDELLGNWKNVIDTWKKSKYKVGMYLSYEHLVGLDTGTATLQKLALLLRNQGFETLPNEKIMFCTWFQGIGREHIETHHKHKYEFTDFVPGYTRRQRDKMLLELSGIMEEYADDRQLISILKEYYDDIRENTRIDIAYTPPTAAPTGPFLDFKNCEESPKLPSPRQQWDTKPLWFPSYPYAFDLTHLRNLVNGISGMTLSVKDIHHGRDSNSKNCHSKTSETAGCFTFHPFLAVHHPNPEGRMEDFSQEIVLLIRNPKTALPFHHNSKENAFHNNDGQVEENRWRKTRDQYFHEELESWKKSIKTWKDMKYKVGMYLSYERLVGVDTGLSTLKKLADLLRNQGFQIIPDEQIPSCVWFQAIGREHIERHHNHKYEFTDFVPGYTRSQRDKLLFEISGLMEDYAGEEELISILEEYYEDIRENTRIDTVVIPPS